MKQVTRSSRRGRIAVSSSFPPQAAPGQILVQTAYSLVSAGTERMALEFDSKSLFAKARSRPDLVRKVIERARKEGVVPAVVAALDKLEEVRPLGYSSAGLVVHSGEETPTLLPGAMVACAGAGYANHAEMVSVPASLVSPVPSGVSLDSACYTTVASIALHGVRLGLPTLGERAIVIGCGLIGQIAIQLLTAQGLTVLAVDTDHGRLDLALSLGARHAARPGKDDIRAMAGSISDGFGMDLALICAASETSQPVELAAETLRERGRMVAVGATGLTLPRRAFYDKELSFRISRSYGPGRYDPVYEEQSIDYPIGYVRWTEGRNFQAILELMQSGALNVSKLTTHRFSIDRATEAYELVRSGREPFLGIVLEYPRPVDEVAEPSVCITTRVGPSAKSISFLGAGSFARSVLLPAFREAGADLRTISSVGGLSATDLAVKFGFATVGSEDDVIGGDASSVVIATRHDSHAVLAARALRAGKNVFVEKPLAIDEVQLLEVLGAAESSAAILMVGFNRRFAPATLRLRDFLSDVSEPLLMNVRINAGPLPVNHWVQDPKIGGGRLIGEACHFIDWMAFVCGAVPVEVFALSVDARRVDFPNRDQTVLSISFSDGSVGVLTYSGRGDARLAKERYEVFAAERSAVIDDFRSLRTFFNGRERLVWKGSQDKGHRSEVVEFLAAATAGRRPITYRELASVTRATFAAEESLRSGRTVSVG